MSGRSAEVTRCPAGHQSRPGGVFPAVEPAPAPGQPASVVPAAVPPLQAQRHGRVSGYSQALYLPLVSCDHSTARWALFRCIVTQYGSTIVMPQSDEGCG